LRRIGIVGQSRYGDLGATARAVATFAGANGLTLSVEERLADLLPGARAFVPGEIDLLLTLGGDGTLLRGARMVAPFHTPVLGINLGYLGFLTSVGVADLDVALARVLAGDYWLDTRMTLEAVVHGSDGAPSEPYVCLNDAVLHKGGFARSIRLAVRVGQEEEPVATYAADGIILSTPTGSTAYSLSAGAAIVVPTVECILATPICPHTLAIRPLILPASTVVSVEVLSPSEELMLTVDGTDGEGLQPGDRLVVRRGAAAVPLVRFPGQSFFATLRRKLHWSIAQDGRR
jgi:NAD+ kinase